MAQAKTASVKITSAVVLGVGKLGLPGETHDLLDTFAAELIGRGKARLVGEERDVAPGAGPVEQVAAAVDATGGGAAPEIGEGSLADKVRAVIEALGADGFLASGAPDLKAVKAALPAADAAQVSAAVRDEVFGAMVQGGFIAPQAA